MAATRVSIQKVSRDKWKPLDGTLAPPSIDAWTYALAHVDRSKTRLSSKPSKNIYGYRFPEPGLIAYAENRLDRYTINGLHLRVAVQHRVYIGVDSNPTQVPIGCSNDEWRTILNSSYGQLDFAEEHDNRRQVEIHRSGSSSRRDTSSQDSRRELVKAMFGAYPSAESVTQVTWRNHTIQSGQVALLNPAILREIVWDLSEHNFRADLLALDRILAPGPWANDRISRDCLLKSVFPGGDSYLCNSVPDEPRGIASTDWTERREFFGRLASAMSSWPSAPPELSSYSEVTQSEKSFSHTERRIALFFCQTVFDQFGRPAIIPCRIRF